MANLPYDEKDISSIFNYSKQLVNKCLRDFAPNAEEHKGKGSLGQLVEELFFKYDLNSRQEADFAFVNAELKCTPLKKSAKEELLIKERLVCSMINYTADWDKPFEQSHFYKKCLIMLIMFYLHNPKVSKLDLQFLFAVLWKIPQKDLLIIRDDYEKIITKIRNGQAHTLSEGDTMYLGACRKGQKGESLMPQHNNEVGAPRRAWSLKTAYMRTVLDEVKKNNQEGAYCNYDFSKSKIEMMFSVRELKNKTVDEILLGRFKKYCGKTYQQICNMLKIGPSKSKSKYFIISNTIAGKGKVGNVNKSEEFLKSGLTMKTIRVKKTGSIKEAMSFPDYLDRASRTIITGEGGAGPSRFKHIIKTESGRYRRLVPVELERLNMFPDNHTFGSSDLRRAFLMGNALVTGIVENISLVLKTRM